MGACDSSNSSRLRLENEMKEEYKNFQDIPSKHLSSSSIRTFSSSIFKSENSKKKVSSKNGVTPSLSSTSLIFYNIKDLQKKDSSELFEKENTIENTQYLLPETIAKREDVFKNYKLSKKEIGNGATSSVYPAEDSSKKKFAIKRINKNKISKRKNMIINEAEICLKLNHKNIVKCYEIYEDMNYISIVMELGEADLFDLTLTNPLRVVSEEIAVDYLIQIFEAIDYLHNVENIIHCDIKPENFIVKFDKKNKKPILKLTDFGNIRKIPLNKERLHNYCGTKECMPPEALEKCGFNEKADEWAAGIMMYHVLTGSDPFTSNNDYGYKKNIKYKEIDFDIIKNKRLRELNKKLLNRSCEERISAKEALIEIKKIKHHLKKNNNIISLKESKNNGIIETNKDSLTNMA